VTVRRLLIVCVFASLALVAGPVPTAGAHPQSTSAVLLEVAEDSVGGEVQLPIDRLAVAVDRELTAESVLGTDRAFLTDYTAAHVTAVGADGREWAVGLGTPEVRTIDAVEHLVYPLQLTPPDGAVTAFDLRYDVVVEELRTHKVVVTVAYDFSRGILTDDDAQTLGIVDFATPVVEVPAGEGSWARGLPPPPSSGWSTSARAPTTCSSCSCCWSRRRWWPSAAGGAPARTPDGASSAWCT